MRALHYIDIDKCIGRGIRMGEWRIGKDHVVSCDYDAPQLIRDV
jgi:hypothetical protein